MTSRCRASRATRVMIVDDDHWVVRGLQAALGASPDIEVVGIGRDAESAVQIYRECKPDAVLMDIAMPGDLSGIDATEAILRYDPGAVVIVLTTTAPGAGLIRAVDVGACAVLSKSASDDEIVRVIHAAVHGDDPRLLEGLLADLRLSSGTGPGLGATPELTGREREVLALICKAHSYAAIAEKLKISEWTVKSHTKVLREKLFAGNLAQLVVRALEYRFIT